MSRRNATARHSVVRTQLPELTLANCILLKLHSVWQLTAADNIIALQMFKDLLLFYVIPMNEAFESYANNFT